MESGPVGCIKSLWQKLGAGPLVGHLSEAFARDSGEGFGLVSEQEDAGFNVQG